MAMGNTSQAKQMAPPMPIQLEPIAIVGCACRFPGPASNVSKLWEFLKAPYDISKEIPKERFDINGFYHEDARHGGTFNTRKSYFLEDDPRCFDAGFFQIHPREAETMDPQQRMLLETVFEAMESAGFTMDGMQGSQTSVFVGGMSYDFRDALYIRDPASIPEYAATGAHASMLAARISYFFDWKGPSMSIDTACSSSLVAVHQAVRTLRNGDATIAVAAGSNLILEPEQYIALSNLRMLSPTGQIRMWDSQANGYARGEGFGVVLLKTLTQALEDGDHIHCLIRESGVGQDGKTTGITMPSPDAQKSLIRRTYELAGLDPYRKEDRPHYFEAHGTGTPTGDPIEAEAIHGAFFSSSNDLTQQNIQPLYVGSVKTCIGHLEGAAGIAGLIKAALAVEAGIIPPNLHFNELNPKIAPYYGPLKIPITYHSWPVLPGGTPRRASVNSFGFGGTNAHIILESFDNRAASQSKIPTAEPITPLIISAKSHRSLALHLDAVATYMEKFGEIGLEAIFRTFQTRRTLLPIRASFSSLSRKEIIRSMRELAQDETQTAMCRAHSKRSRIFGIFTGQGAQYAMMGKSIVERSFLAQETLRCLQDSLSALPDPPSWSLRDEILASTEASRVHDAALSQPLCTAIQIILVNHLRSAGVTLDVIIGHSSGEIAAAYAGGLISAIDAIRIAYYRGVHAKLAIGGGNRRGGMIAVGLSLADAQDFCSQLQFLGRLSVAANNSPSSSTIAGDIDALEEAETILNEKRVFVRRLVVDTAYHSHHMLPCAEPYRQSLRQCQISILEPKNQCKWVSSVSKSGAILDSGSLGVEYWVNNLTCPVLFESAIKLAVARHGYPDIAIEIGPHPALKGPAMDTLSALLQQDENTRVVSYQGTLNRKQESSIALSSTLGFLSQRLSPLCLDFDAYRQAWYGPSYSQPLLVKDLPTYSWDHSATLYRESRISKRFLGQSDPPHDLLGTRLAIGDFQSICFRNIVSVKSFPWLQGHKIQGQIVLPAMWYVALTLEAAKELFSVQESSYVEIENFDILKAVTLEENDVLEVLFNIQKNESESTTTKTVADLRCHVGGLFDISDPKQSFQGRLKIHCNESYLGFPNHQSSSGDTADLVGVEHTYEVLRDIGYEYSGLFRALGSIKRSSQSVIATANVEQSEPFVHPATLDLCLQSLLAAFFKPEDEYENSILLPKRVGRILINTASIQNDVKGISTKTFNSAVGDYSSSGMTGDIEVYGQTGELQMQFEEVIWTPLNKLNASDDRKLFAKTTWESDVYNGKPIQVNEYGVDEQELVSACDRAAWYYYRRLKQIFTASEIETAEWHYSRLFSFIDYILPRLENGEYPTVKPGWSTDTLEDISLLSAKYPASADLRLIRTVGDNLPTTIRERRPMLEFMMEDDKLNNYYRTGLGYEKAYQILHTMVTRIAHRYPQMKILEVGAGTGGATKHALDALEGMFLSYTFTDVSSGFFEKAQTTFQDHLHMMIFKIFDLEKHPSTQGYEEGSYDLIIGSLVIHATRDVSKTLQYIRWLLKPGGYLVLVEGSQDTLRSGFVMSGLPGWWLGGENRPWGPMLSLEHWSSLLLENGFSGIDAVTLDSSRPCTNLGAVFISQAVDDLTRLLRAPLDHPDQIHASGPITIVGGSSPSLKPLADEISNLLRPTSTHHQTIATIDGMQNVEVPSEGGVLCLFELDEPVFKSLTEPKLRGLQHIIAQAETIMFIIRKGDPHSTALLGLIRSLRLEIPHLKLQTIAVNPNEVDASFIAESFLRLVHHPQSEKGILWTLEPEIEWSDNIISIPRVVLDNLPNYRLNSRRRLITERVNCKTTTVKICAGTDGYILKRKRQDRAANERKFIVSHSTLHQVTVGESSGHLLLGKIDSSGHQGLIYANENLSVVMLTEGDFLPVKVEVGDEAPFLSYLQASFTANSLIDAIRPNRCMLVHEADPSLRRIILKEMHRRGEQNRVHFSSCSQISPHHGSLYLHPHMPRRQLRDLLKKLNIGIFVDTSTGLMSDSISKCLHSIKLINTNNASEQRLSEDGLQVITSKASEAINSAIRQFEDDQPLREDRAPDELIVAIDGIRDMAKHDLAKTIDWTGKSKLSVEFQEVEESFQLFSPNRTYLLFGLTGTLGQSLCEWIVHHGGCSIVLTSRSPQIQSSWLDSMAKIGGIIKVCPLDICNPTTLRQFISNITETMPPIGGVVNGAMILRDGLFQDMSFEAMESCLGPKVTGSMLLDEIFYNSPLEFFIAISSIAWVVGNPGQSNYSAANGYMAGLARARRSRGLAASVMSIGVVAGVGYLSRTKAGHEQEHAKRRNVMTISERELHTIFAEAIIAGRPESGHCAEIIAGLNGTIDTSITSKESLAAWLSDPRVSRLISDRNGTARVNFTSKEDAVSLTQKLMECSNRTESVAVLIGAFSTKLERMLLLESGTVHESQPLVEMGVDSLLAVEIRSFFKAELKIDVPILRILGGSTLFELSILVFDLFTEPFGATEQTSRSPAENSDNSTLVKEYYSDSTTSLDTPRTEDDQTTVYRRVIMSYCQARMFRINQFDPSPRVNNLCVAYDIDGFLDMDKFKSSFEATVLAQESLRTKFYMDSNELIQEVMTVPIVTLAGKHVSSQEDIDAEFDKINNIRFDLATGKTMVAVNLSLSPISHVLICCFHHIVLDTRSIEIFFHDLNRAYGGERLGPTQHPADFAVYERRALASGEWLPSADYWRSQHSYPGATTVLPLFPFALVTERKRMQRYGMHTIRHDLPSTVTATIKRICGEQKLSPYHFHLTVFQILLTKLLPAVNGDLCIGSVDANRAAHPDFDDTFGPMFNYLPLRFHVPTTTTCSFSELCLSTRKTCYMAAGHSQVPFDTILSSITPSIEPMPITHHPLYQVQINYLQHNLEDIRLGEEGLRLKERNASGVDVSYDLCLSILDNPRGGTRVLLHAQEYLYAEESLQWLVEAYMKLLYIFIEEFEKEIFASEIDNVFKSS